MTDTPKVANHGDKAHRFDVAKREVGKVLERLAHEHGTSVAIGATVHLMAALAARAGTGRKNFLDALGYAYDVQVEYLTQKSEGAS